MKLFSILSLLILFTVPTLADILYIGLNNNPLEIKKASEAAIARGEKLIIIPSGTTQDELKRFKELTRYFLFEKEKFSKLSAQEQSKLSTENENLKKKIYLDKEKLSGELNKIKMSGAKVSSLIISGHDGNGEFTGTFGSLTSQDFRTVIEENRPLGDDIRSLILAGCYTGTIGSIETNWKNIAPNIALIAGYDEKAPLGDKAAGLDYISEILKKEKSLVDAADKKALEIQFNNIKNINLLNAQICTNKFFVNNHEVLSKSELYNLCEKYFDGKKATEWQEKTFCFLRGSAGCEVIPENTSDSELRTMYNEVQSIEHCRDLLIFKNIPIPSSDQIIRLIFYKNVSKNISIKDAKLFKTFDDQLTKLGVPKEKLFGDVSKLSRSEIVSRLNSANEVYTTILNDASFLAGPQVALFADFKENLKFVSKTVSLGNDYIPFSWVEPETVEIPKGKPIAFTFEGKQRVLANQYLEVINNNFEANNSSPNNINLMRKKYLYKELQLRREQIPSFSGSPQEKILLENLN